MGGSAKEHRALLLAAVMAVLATVSPLPGQARTDEVLRRVAVGSVPEGFQEEPVDDARGAARYVTAYIRALGLEGVRVHRVVATPDRYFVYVRETDGEREAFALEVRPDGALRAKRFPGMYPEMMWNQKYGHRARRDPRRIQEPVPLAEARQRSREAVAAAGLVPGPPLVYHGYALFPLLDAQDRLVGEAAVDRFGGDVVWARFPEGPVRTVEIPLGRGHQGPAGRSRGD